MIRCGSKKGYQKDTCSKAIGVHMHKIYYVLSSQHNWRVLYDHTIRNENLGFDNEQDIRVSPERSPGKWLRPRSVFANHIREISTTSIL